MPMIASPMRADDHLPAGQVHQLGRRGVGAVLARRRAGPGGRADGGDADDDVDDRLAGRGDPLADLGEPLLVAVAEHRPRGPARRRAGTCRSRSPRPGPAPNGCSVSCWTAPWESAELLLVAEGQLDRQPGDEQVDHAVGDQPDPGGVVDPLAVAGLLSRALGAVGDAAHGGPFPLHRSRYPRGAARYAVRPGPPARSRSPGGRSGRRRSSSAACRRVRRRARRPRGSR